MDDSQDLPASHPQVRRDGSMPTDDFLAQFEIDDTDTFITTNAGGPIEEQESLSAGERGPTLLEDFAFREKIMHFGRHLVTFCKTLLTYIRSRASSRESCTCSRCWCPWYFCIVRRLVQFDGREFSLHAGEGDTSFHQILNGGWQQR
jgi:hypothetical protein